MIKQPITVFLFLLTALSATAQTYTIGDTTNMHVLNLNLIVADTSVQFDADCDGTPDLNFSSNIGGKYYRDWARLRLRMQPHTEVLNSNIGKVTRFEVGDVVNLGDNIWTSSLDFIYGTGPTLPYGWDSIDRDFIAFRKITPLDTFYVFFEITTLRAHMQIHRVIYSCPGTGIVTSVPQAEIKQLTVYPNPFVSNIQFSSVCRQVAVYNVSGNLVREFRNTAIINLADLPKGIYYLQVWDKRGIAKRVKAVKL